MLEHILGQVRSDQVNFTKPTDYSTLLYCSLDALLNSQVKTHLTDKAFFIRVSQQLQVPHNAILYMFT